MAENARILVVDDEPKICEFLAILLGREGYQVDSANSAADGLARIEATPYDLVLTDLKMPGMDGFELVTRLKAARPELPVIMITGYATVETAVRALRHGVEDYVTKPFNIDELRKVISRALRGVRMEHEQQDLAAELKQADEELARFRNVMEEQCAAAIRTLAAELEARDRYMRGHMQRVAEYACALAEACGVRPEEIEILHRAADLHDIGQIAVSEQILTKPGALTEEERALVRNHPAAGERIIGPMTFLGAARPIIRSHHERMDGSGYPDGLRGDAIPRLARMLTVADSFDAMTSERPYRPAMSRQRAAEEMEAGAGRQFDPELVRVFCHQVIGGL
jgi:putative two-component system response regulator